jgi:hypothetical protein
MVLQHIRLIQIVILMGLHQQIKVLQQINFHQQEGLHQQISSN